MHLENFKNISLGMENIVLENFGFNLNIFLEAKGYWPQEDTRDKITGSLGLMPPEESIERPCRVNSLEEPLFEILQTKLGQRRQVQI